MLANLHKSQGWHIILSLAFEIISHRISSVMDRQNFIFFFTPSEHTRISFYNLNKKTDPHNEGKLTRSQHQRQKRPDRLASKEASFPIENGDIINTVTFQQ